MKLAASCTKSFIIIKDILTKKAENFPVLEKLLCTMFALSTKIVQLDY